MMIILVILATAFSMLLAALMRGFIFMKLWAWFAIPAFGFAPIPFILAAGVAFLIAFSTMKSDVRPEDLECIEDYFWLLLNNITEFGLFCLIILFNGWLITLFL